MTIEQIRNLAQSLAEARLDLVRRSRELAEAERQKKLAIQRHDEMRAAFDAALSKLVDAEFPPVENFR